MNFKLFLIAIGGAIGTVSRYGINGFVSNHQSQHYPWSAAFPLGTLMINVSGSFVVGLLAAISGPGMGRVWIKPEWRDFLIIGFCGGYTTFSSYSLQTLNLARDTEWLGVGLNIVGSNALSLLAVYLGRVCGLYLQSRIVRGW